MAVLDLSKAAQETARLGDDLRASGLLEQMRAFVDAADPYVRRARRAVRELEPQAEHVGQATIVLDDDTQAIGTTLRDQWATIEEGLRAAASARSYLAELEKLWRNLKA